MRLPLGLALQTPTTPPQPPPAGQAELVALQTALNAQWLALLQAVLVIVIATVGLRIALTWTGSAMRRARVDTGTQILVRRGLSVAVIIVAALVVLGILGVSAAGLVTVVGAVGLAFSLATQDILKNFFSGVYLLLERPFRVGDTIRVRDQEGVVENIGVRTTSLRTPDNVYVLVPNMIVFAEVVANRSHAQPGHPATAGADGHATDTDGHAADGQAAADAHGPAATPTAATPTGAQTIQTAQAPAQAGAAERRESSADAAAR